MSPIRRQFARHSHARSELVSHQHLNHLLITSGSQGRYSSELDALQQHSGDSAGWGEGGRGGRDGVDDAEEAKGKLTCFQLSPLWVSSLRAAVLQLRRGK